MDSKTFRKALEFAGMTRYSFSKKTGMHWQTVAGYYSGKQKIPQKMVAIIELVTGYKNEKNKKARSTQKRAA